MKKIFIDGGVNDGRSIDLFRKKWPDAKEYEIHSFECNPRFSSILNRKGVCFHNTAVWIKDEEIDFYLGNPLGSSLCKDKFTGNLNKNPIKVQGIDLAKFITENFLKEDYIVLKLDIEGGEYDVLPHLIKENIIPDYINELYGEWHGNKITPIDYWIDFSHKLEKELDSLGFMMEGHHWCAPKNIVNRDYYLKK